MADPTRVNEAQLRELAAQYSPDFQNAVMAVSQLESSKGAAATAYAPNKVGAIGPMQILSRQLGARYGNFEQYAAPGMIDPMNPVHSSIAGIRMFDALAKKHGVEGGVNAYFSGSPTPRPGASDGLTTAGNYLRKFREEFQRSLPAGAGRGIGGPELVNGLAKSETGGMRAADAANVNSADVNPQGTYTPMTTRDVVAANIDGASGKLNIQGVFRDALESMKQLAIANKKSMGTFGMDDADPTSAVSVGGRHTAGSIKALADVYDRHNARFNGPERDAQNPLQRLGSMIFGSAADSAEAKRIKGQLHGMQSAVGGNQDLATKQQSLNAQATPDVSKLLGVAAQATAREDNSARLAQGQEQLNIYRNAVLDQSQQKIDNKQQSAESVEDSLIQAAAAKVGASIPVGVRPANWARVMGKDTVDMLQSVAAGGSLGPNPVAAMARSDSAGVSQSTREALAPTRQTLQAIKTSSDYIRAESAQKFSMDPGQRDVEKATFFANYVSDQYRGMAQGVSSIKDSPYRMSPGAVARFNASNPVPDSIKALAPESLNDATIMKTIASNSKQPAQDIANYYTQLMTANNAARRFDLLGAPQAKGYFVPAGQGKMWDLTNPADANKALGAAQANAKAAQETPGLFASLSDLFGKPAQQAPVTGKGGAAFGIYPAP